MKTKSIASLFVLIAAGVYLAYRASGADDISGLWDWLLSIATRASLKTNSLLGDFMNQDQTQSAVSKALAFIADKEGFSHKAYPDPKGQTKLYSIGYGHQLKTEDGLTTTSIIDEATAYQLLSDDTQHAVDCVFSAITVDLTPNQAAACISLCYNIGCAAFKGSSLVKRINNGDQSAGDEFPRWVYAEGEINEDLVARRADEQSLFES